MLLMVGLFSVIAMAAVAYFIDRRESAVMKKGTAGYVWSCTSSWRRRR